MAGRLNGVPPIRYILTMRQIARNLQWTFWLCVLVAVLTGGLVIGVAVFMGDITAGILKPFLSSEKMAWLIAVGSHLLMAVGALLMEMSHEPQTLNTALRRRQRQVGVAVMSAAGGVIGLLSCARVSFAMEEGYSLWSALFFTTVLGALECAAPAVAGYLFARALTWLMRVCKERSYWWTNADLLRKQENRAPFLWFDAYRGAVTEVSRLEALRHATFAAWENGETKDDPPPIEIDVPDQMIEMWHHRADLLNQWDPGRAYDGVVVVVEDSDRHNGNRAISQDGQRRLPPLEMELSDNRHHDELGLRP